MVDQAALDAVASPRRRRILRLVWEDELAAGDVAARFEDVSWPAISQHLKVLREAGLVVERRDGRHRLYRADRSSMGPLAAMLEQLWADDLDRLAALAEEEAGLADDADDADADDE
ncbi:MAG: metalloregulator ArsR/SmtB family transcription factor [Nitriliruptorales bacterium]|nr:metalloregulator ArsR/SmtB family transcription factor [Nitriliruptorales bacterium]